MDSPYKVKHWSPVKRIPKSVDGWWNVLEWEDIDIESEEQKCSSDFLFF